MGDWNLLLDPSIGCKNCRNINNPKSKSVVNDIISSFNLYDVWRDENLDLKQYTWCRKLNNNNLQMGRLDFFLVSDSLTHYTSNEKISAGYRSDHSLISITLNFQQNYKPKTFWKFNNSLLRSQEYVDKVKETILNVKKQYAATPYNQDDIHNIDNYTLQLTINDQLFFEMVLLEIRSATISFATNKKREENKTKKELEEEIYKLESYNLELNYDEIQNKKK